MTIVSRTDQPAQRYRIIFGDTDAGGIVYHPRYLELAERGRNETMRQVGLDVGKLFADEGFGLALRSLEMKFLAPAKFDDLLVIRTSIGRLRSASATWITLIQRGPTDICTVSAEIICMDRTRHVPAMFPPHVVTAFDRAIALKTGAETEHIQ